MAARDTSSTAAPLRLAQRAWRELNKDSARAIALADQALARAGGDAAAEGWARIVRGHHLLYFATPPESRTELALAKGCFERAGDRAGWILCGALEARALWREGQFRAAIAHVLPLRDEGMGVLRNEQRGVLLNTIAGCYSAQGDSEQAFAYMYQAMRDAPPVRGHGLDVVLHCNLAHELLQLGDYHEALRHVDQGIERCSTLNNPRLLSVLRINRIICLTELDRAREALPDVERVRDHPADASGRGAIASHFETLAIAALRAGEVAMGDELIARAESRAVRVPIPDEHVELAIARAMRAQAVGDPASGIAALALAAPYVVDAGAEGLSPRTHCMYYRVASELHEQAGDNAQALALLRRAQQLHERRAQLSSRARYQAASLQTELLQMQHKLAENDAQRRATEKSHAELASINRELSARIEQVQSLERALREQATRDELTGLFNRRHLNEILPALWAASQRERMPLAAVIIDLDHFKSVNDHHGHLAGDLLLARFGKLLAADTRKSDIVCRYGGEEFCLLMPRTDAVTARRKAQALLERWQAAEFKFDDTMLRGLSFSAGVADTKRAQESATQLLRVADDELLSAKRLGRARVLMAESA